MVLMAVFECDVDSEGLDGPTFICFAFSGRLHRYTTGESHLGSSYVVEHATDPTILDWARRSICGAHVLALEFLA